MKINQKGCGSWTSYCPICGLHFSINVDEDLEDLIEYHSKPGSKNKRKGWSNGPSWNPRSSPA